MKILKMFLSNLSIQGDLQESVSSAYNTLFEGYADVVHNHDLELNAFDSVRQKAANLNSTMNFLLRSEQIRGTIFGDSEPELDSFRTSPFNQVPGYEYEPKHRGDIIEDSMGLTTEDMEMKQLLSTPKQADIPSKLTRKSPRKYDLSALNELM